MIWADEYVIGHLQKTGGDAVKQIYWELDFPGVVFHRHNQMNPGKHKTFLEAGCGDDRLRVLVIRRLPAWELSAMHQSNIFGDEAGVSAPVTDGAGVTAAAYGEKLLERWEKDRPVDVWLRMEFLREDLERFIGTHHRLNDWHRQIIRTLPTKDPNKYDHRLGSFFTPAQVSELYEKSPRWTQLEQKLYGSLAAV